MMVVPESMMVSKFFAATASPTFALAPVTCQNPDELSTSWNSRSPVYFSVSVPPRKSSEPLLARKNPNWLFWTTPCSLAVLKKGFCFMFDMAGNANPRIPS